MKGPASSQSDNLNPWQWKQERAPRSKDTAPSSITSENTFEKADALQSDYVLVPASAVDKLADYIPLDRLTVKKILEQNPALKESINIHEKAVAKENGGDALRPLARQEELVAPQGSPCSQSTGDVLVPAIAPDKLDGYEERYFLKIDGYDDVS